VHRAGAEVIVYDYLCNPEMLKWAPKECELSFAGKKAGAHTLLAGGDQRVARGENR
jgi:siroheme synthase